MSLFSEKCQGPLSVAIYPSLAPPPLPDLEKEAASRMVLTIAKQQYFANSAMFLKPSRNGALEFHECVCYHPHHPSSMKGSESR